MNITIEMKGLKELQSKLSDLEKKQFPYAVAKTLTKTAQDVQAAEIKEMQARLDRPTPYAQRSLYIKPATRRDLSAQVFFKDKNSLGKGGTPAANFMKPQVEGGKRSLKRFESALKRMAVLPSGFYIAPGDACPLDAYGNIPRSLIVQILSYFKAFGEQGYRANITDKRKASMAKGSKKNMGFEYFVSYGKGTRSGRQNLPAGIWKRVSFAQGTAVKPIMMFVKEPSYSKRFPFYEIAQKVINTNLDKNFKEAMSEAIRTAK